MVKVLVFTWNSNKIPFCEADFCQPINFWSSFADRIRIYYPDIIIFGSQEELCCQGVKSTLHSSFLPNQLLRLGYQLISGKSLDCGNHEAIQTSVYSKIPIYPVDILPDYVQFNSLSGKKGALSSVVSISKRSLLICNVKLSQGYLKEQLSKVLRDLFYTPACDYIICLGSFNSKYTGKLSLSKVISNPSEAIAQDSLYNLRNYFGLKEGYEDLGPEFPPTCQLSTRRKAMTPPVIGNDLEASFEAIKLNGDQILESSHEPVVQDYDNSWGWCDRILHADLLGSNRLKCLLYERLDDPSTSLSALKHSVVIGLYDLN